MKNKYRICAIIVTYNCGNDVYNTINSVVSKVNELIIVDNGSDKDTIEALQKYREHNNITILFNKDNLGIAKALNIGANYAIEKDYEWILTLDDDSIVTENMIHIMLQAYEGLNEQERVKVALLAPKHVEKTIQINNEKIDKDTKFSISKVNTEITSGNLIKTKILKQINLYKEDFFIDFVDHYLCLVLKKKGYEIIRVEEAILLHSLGISHPKVILGKAITVTNHSPIRRYYMTRNRMNMWREFKNEFPDWVSEDRMRFINETIKILLYEKSKWRKMKMIIKGIRDYKRGKSGAIN
jgi:rhamnosyltransferase